MPLFHGAAPGLKRPSPSFGIGATRFRHTKEQNLAVAFLYRFTRNAAPHLWHVFSIDVRLFMLCLVAEVGSHARTLDTSRAFSL
jgi:hypothetical protein